MVRKKKLISTIIATHNRPRLLTRTLSCLVQQTYRPIEVLVVDDGSGSTTREAVAKWKASAQPDLTVLYQWQENQGPATARNKGLEASSGDLIHFLDDDDLLCASALARLAYCLGDEDPAIAMGSYQYWEEGQPIGAIVQPPTMCLDEILKSMIQGTWFVPIHGYLFTRSAMERIGPWNPALTSQEDDELLLRAVLAEIPLRPISDARVYYCQHDGVRRATPGKPGESVYQGMEKRMYADLAIRESAFESLSAGEDMEQYLYAFSSWRKRFTRRYSSMLYKLDLQSEMLDWLMSTDDQWGVPSSASLPEGM